MTQPSAQLEQISKSAGDASKRQFPDSQGDQPLADPPRQLTVYKIERKTATKRQGAYSTRDMAVYAHSSQALPRVNQPNVAQIRGICAEHVSPQEDKIQAQLTSRDQDIVLLRENFQMMDQTI